MSGESFTPKMRCVGFWVWWVEGCLIRVEAKSGSPYVWVQPTTTGRR